MAVRLRAVDQLLDRGVRFRLPAPFYKRWLGMNCITIKPLRPGTILHIAKVVVENKLEASSEEFDWAAMSSEKLEAVAKCVAIAMLNDADKIERKTAKLTKRLMWKYPVSTLLAIYRVLYLQNSKADFTNITRFICQQAAMINLGQKITGS